MIRRLFLAGIALTIFFLIGFWLWFPSESEMKGCIVTKMYKVDLCPGSKNYVPLAQISRHLQNAVVLTEDSSFYQHNGFDEEGIERCIEKIKEKKRIVCGGSTLSQQLSKNMFLTMEKNFLRKGVEALITIRLEKTLTKKEILERYLNVVQFGKNIFGVKQASQFYFKKSPLQLNPNEAAFLAMVLPNPEKYSQSFFRKDLTKFARNRVTQIVAQLHKYGRLDDGTFNEAAGEVNYFIKGEKAPPPAENTSELTAEDLDEMIGDINQDTAPSAATKPVDKKDSDSLESELEKQ